MSKRIVEAIESLMAALAEQGEHEVRLEVGAGAYASLRKTLDGHNPEPISSDDSDRPNRQLQWGQFMGLRIICPTGEAWISPRPLPQLPPNPAEEAEEKAFLEALHVWRAEIDADLARGICPRCKQPTIKDLGVDARQAGVTPIQGEWQRDHTDAIGTHTASRQGRRAAKTS